MKHDLRERILKNKQLNRLLMHECDICFYHSATREPIFSCKYLDEEEEIICDDILSNNIGMWILETSGMTREEFESYKSKD